jgi:hypothetical protein
MIVYANREETVSTRSLIDRIIGAGPTEHLIRLGQLEAGAVDALCPNQDDTHPIAAALRSIALGDAPVEILKSLTLPREVNIRPPEGYAFYSVYPMQYEKAARRFASESRPTHSVVLGIRSIGTSLSAVVAKTLREAGAEVWSWTVRPHGHPFDRKLTIAKGLRTELLKHRNEWFCIVDEGPGISGSSFASVAEALGELGVADERIVFFPSHYPNIDGLLSAGARAKWQRPVYVEPFPLAMLIPKDALDVSGGLWRDVIGVRPPVQPQHERRKYLHGSELWKFAGLAHLGEERFQRGQVLSDAGFVPRILQFRNGFIVSEFVRSQPVAENELLDVIARYLAFLRREFATGQIVRYAEIREMVRVNSGTELPERDSLIEDGVVVAGDGRMLPHEWAGLLKTDAIDHHDDHFFPGCQDIAWDIAGAAVEFDVPEDAILDRYLAIQKDPTLRRRMPFYRTAYLSYRIGYADMAAASLRDSADGARFRELKRRYTAALLGALRPASSIA